MLPFKFNELVKRRALIAREMSIKNDSEHVICDLYSCPFLCFWHNEEISQSVRAMSNYYVHTQNGRVKSEATQPVWYLRPRVRDIHKV